MRCLLDYALTLLLQGEEREEMEGSLSLPRQLGEQLPREALPELERLEQGGQAGGSVETLAVGALGEGLRLAPLARALESAPPLERDSKGQQALLAEEGGARRLLAGVFAGLQKQTSFGQQLPLGQRAQQLSSILQRSGRQLDISALRQTAREGRGFVALDAAAAEGAVALDALSFDRALERDARRYDRPFLWPG